MGRLPGIFRQGNAAMVFPLPRLRQPPAARVHPAALAPLGAIVGGVFFADLQVDCSPGKKGGFTRE